MHVKEADLLSLIQRGHAEQIARNEFLSSERDPIPCSLLYFALNKKATVYGLWRQAYGHKEQQAMLKFLSNDFEQERWKGAALKNAYALLSKQRYGESLCAAMRLLAFLECLADIGFHRICRGILYAGRSTSRCDPNLSSPNGRLGDGDHVGPYLRLSSFSSRKRRTFDLGIRQMGQ